MNRAAPVDWNALSLSALFDALARADAERAVRAALVEDLGANGAATGDLTSVASIPDSLEAEATVVARADGVVAGLPVAAMVAEALGVGFAPAVADGTRVARGATLAVVRGRLAPILAAERTMLNFLTLLSGNATLAARFVDAVRGTRAAICDTRKTVPGLRTLQKYATRCGGGTLHRIGLFDAVLLKDNHLAAFSAGTLAERVRIAAERARARRTPAFVECEVDSLAQLDELLALERGVLDLVLLDNMSPADMTDAVRRRDARAPWIGLEASGGVRLETVRAIAETGVDRISAGAITHSAPALDIALDLTTAAPGAGAR